jgi:cell division protein FtsZ
MNTNEIKIIGVGTAGIEVLERMQPNTIKNIDLIVCDIATINLSKSSVENKIQLETGKTTTLYPIIPFEKDCHLNVELDIAIDATINAFDQFVSLITENTNMAILIANVGDTTGTGVTPVIAQIAKKSGLFVAAIVYTPFDLLGKNAKKIANYGLMRLSDDCDLVLVIDNNKLQKLYGTTSFKNFAKKAEEIVIRLVKMILPLETTNSDLLNLRSFFNEHQNDKNLFIGIGEASGKWRARQAIEEALKNVLYYREDIEGTTNVFLDIYCGNNEISIDEKAEIKKSVIQNAGKDINVVFSVNQHISLEESVSIIVVAL